MSGTKIQLSGEGIIVSGDYRPIVNRPVADDYPLVVAIHGGSYTHKYFDIDGTSLLERASALGIPIVAIDRPCYGDSGMLTPEQSTIERSAEVINAALLSLWEQHSGGARGIFLIGHSIGGAVAILVASLAKRWPLLGIAVSGVGMRSPDSVAEQWKSLPPIPSIPLPPEVKDMLMFGPTETFSEEMRLRAHSADSETPRQELLDIVFNWPKLMAAAAPKIAIPLHYRQPEFDHLWVVSKAEVQSFGNSFSSSPRVDAELMLSVGHCIDFHRLGASFQLQQLAFALQCSAPEIHSSTRA
jgi:pimeloyl-ACP methyl ester carboxylesterase